MVFNYRRKTTRAEGWSEESMTRAINAIDNKKTSIRGAAKQFSIPYPTLRKHFIKKSSSKKLGRFRPVFSAEMELELVKHIKDMDARFYGFTKEDLCTLAFEFANQNNLPHNFTTGKAGDQWYYNFMQRHRELSLRFPEPTSIGRACGFNRPQVQVFFDNLSSIREKHKIELDNIYNVDESGIQTSAKRPPKVISVKGKKQVGSIASSERGQLVTTICCCSASGKFIPPGLIFPRKKKNPRYLQGTPPGTIDFVSDNGWVNSEIFLEWMKFFVKSVRPTQEQKCLLILDNHVSHRSLAVLEYASDNHIIILSVPPHCTHKLQPLDVSVYGPMGTYFERAVDKWQKQHPAQHITLYEIGAIFSTAYLQAATPQNAISGFKKTGILEGDIDIFSEVDFAPAEVTNVELEPENSVLATQDLENLQRTPPSFTEAPVPSTSYQIAAPGTIRNDNLSLVIHDQVHEERISLTNPGPSNIGSTVQKTKKTPFVSLDNIKELPKITPKPASRKRKSQKSEILTSTPVKEALRAQQNPNRVKIVKKTKINDLLQSMRIKYPSPPKETTDPEEENVPCLVCGDLYGHSKSGESWVQCNICQEWAHQLCTDYNSRVYICDNCKDTVLKSRYLK